MVATVISEAESSLTNKRCYESCSEHRSTHEDIVDLLHNIRRVSRFKTSIDSTNPLTKDNLVDVSIVTSLTESLTDVSCAEDNLEVENV